MNLSAPSFARAFVALGVILIAPQNLRATLQPDDLLLIVNANLPASRKCADFYKTARHVPDGRIVELNVTAGDELPFDKYERDVVPIIRAFIRKNQLEGKIKCLVTFYGVPIRIGSHKVTPAEQQEIAQIRRLQDETTPKIAAKVEEAEKLAKSMNPSFNAVAGGPEGYPERAARAISVIVASLPKPAEPGYSKSAASLLRLIGALVGDFEVARKFSDEEIRRTLTEPAEKQKWTTRRAELTAANGEVNVLTERRWDPDARKRLRDIVADTFGLFGQASLFRAQLDYLENDGSVASFDNELALLWWDFYSRSGQQPNLLNWHFRKPGKPPIPIVMVMRLDGPQEATASSIILASLRAEKDGLNGRFVIDSTGGTAPGGGVDKQGGYRAFDLTLQRLATLVRSRTQMPLTLDQKPAVFQPGTVKDVALYCGWYSVRNYVPAFTFKPGAVGYHVASFEMVSLRNPDEKGWVPGLLNDGIAATIGSVAEPYLQAFPVPDEFFPLLLTGKMTLAEVYWSTLPQTSWMMSCIGDPLYTPFQKNPQLKVEELPEGMQVLFAATQPSNQLLLAPPARMEHVVPSP